MAMSDYIRNLRDKVGNERLLLPVVGAIVRNEDGQVLLQRRSDNGQWGIPGGIIDPGEAPAQTVVREVLEETGLVVRPQKLIGVFGGEDARFIYPNGHQVEPTILLFECEVVAGRLSCDDGESLELQYFHPQAITKLSGFNNTNFARLLDTPFQWDEQWLDKNELSSNPKRT